MDRLRRASIASSNSDLANSISPPSVRFPTDVTMVTGNAYNVSPATLKKSPPGSSKTIKTSFSNTSLTHQQNSKLVTDTSSFKLRTKVFDVESNSLQFYFNYLIICSS